jgi:predicted DNA-binding transcriptional regulator AlpA
MNSNTSPQLPFLSRDVAASLGIKLATLYGLIRSGRLAEPTRDSSGRFAWDAASVEAARIAMKTDRRKSEFRQSRAGG